MALRFVDGFDHLSVVDMVNLKWDAGNSAPLALVTGAYGVGSAVYSNDTRNTVTKNLDNQDTWTIGFHMQANAGNSFSNVNTLFSWLDAGASQVDLRWDASGHLIVSRNGTTLATGATALQQGVSRWYYVEFKVVIHNSAGTYEVRIDGVTEVSGSGANTRGGTANNYANQLRLFGGSSQAAVSGIIIDNLVVMDGTGGVNNTFLGENRVVTLYPSGAGNTTQWTPSTGANYAAVDETPQNGDTDYVSTSTVTNKDTYAFGDLPAAASAVSGVQVNIVGRKDDVGPRSLAPVVRSGGTDYDGSNGALTSTYDVISQVYEQNPNTSAAWAVAGVNGAEFGVKLTV